MKNNNNNNKKYIFLIFDCDSRKLICVQETKLQLEEPPSRCLWPHNEPYRSLLGQSSSTLNRTGYRMRHQALKKYIYIHTQVKYACRYDIPPFIPPPTHAAGSTRAKVGSLSVKFKKKSDLGPESRRFFFSPSSPIMVLSRVLTHFR